MKANLCLFGKRKRHLGNASSILIGWCRQYCRLGKEKKKKKKKNVRLFRKYFAKRIPKCLPRNISKPASPVSILEGSTCAELFRQADPTFPKRIHNAPKESFGWLTSCLNYQYRTSPLKLVQNVYPTNLIGSARVFRLFCSYAGRYSQRKLRSFQRKIPRLFTRLVSCVARVSSWMVSVIGYTVTKGFCWVLWRRGSSQPCTSTQREKEVNEIACYFLCLPSAPARTTTGFSFCLSGCYHYYYYSVQFSPFTDWPRSGEQRTQNLKSPSAENTELKGSPFKAWSTSVYNHTCYLYCQGVLPC